MNSALLKFMLRYVWCRIQPTQLYGILNMGVPSILTSWYASIILEREINEKERRKTFYRSSSQEFQPADGQPWQLQIVCLGQFSLIHLRNILHAAINCSVSRVMDIHDLHVVWIVCHAHSSLCRLTCSSCSHQLQGCLRFVLGSFSCINIVPSCFVVSACSLSNQMHKTVYPSQVQT